MVGSKHYVLELSRAPPPNPIAGSRFCGVDCDSVSGARADCPTMAASAPDLFLHRAPVLSIDMTSSVSSGVATGDIYQAGGAPPLDLDLPDRRACLLAAAQAAAGWVRARRSVWSDTPLVPPVPVRVSVPPAVPQIDRAATDALLSTLSLDPADISFSTDSAAAASPAALVASDATAPADASNTLAQPATVRLSESVADAALPPVAVSMEVHAPVEATAPVVAWSVSDAALANELDLASAEAFAPFLAEERDAANQAAAARQAEVAHQAEVAALETRDRAPVSAMSDVAVSPAVVDGAAMDAGTVLPVDAPASGPGIAARLGQWARAGAASMLPRWPAFAMLAVLAVIGVSARAYWPRSISRMHSSWSARHSSRWRCSPAGLNNRPR